jgi:hypothetical protein
MTDESNIIPAQPKRSIVSQPAPDPLLRLAISEALSRGEFPVVGGLADLRADFLKRFRAAA